MIVNRVMIGYTQILDRADIDNYFTKICKLKGHKWNGTYFEWFSECKEPIQSDLYLLLFIKLYTQFEYHRKVYMDIFDFISQDYDNKLLLFLKEAQKLLKNLLSNKTKV